ncbi:mRNA cleavage and polyadenylation factor CLP1 [Rhypophila decipiens]|uniref:Polynucleotide 5'-hydroxyl-kinase GRC3 n=1 Tax=Rhypophila decipiens TaxID=261697 RepID=A0AAN6Y7Z3_9PEZI|nr:mRNA cleavage and polyadenylation factor CLP1 [Rhypophila decipiens]
MSIPGIPGLGQINAQPTPSTTSTTRTITLDPGSEWRFVTAKATSSSSTNFLTNPSSTSSSSSGVKVKLLSGSAERDGTSLALNKVYTFSRTKSKIFTWEGCSLEVTGSCVNESVYRPATMEDSCMVGWVNLHMLILQEQRERVSQSLKNHHHHHHGHHKRSDGAGAGGSGPPGPRVMICGAPNTGKTTMARTLAGYATRQGGQPLVASLDPREGLLSLPGTISAAVFGTLMDIEDPRGGFGVRNTPSSGPSMVPVKLPVVYYFGREKVVDDVPLWKDLTRKLASSVRAKLKEVDEVRASGVILDMPGWEGRPDAVGLEVMECAVREFAINTIVVLDNWELEQELHNKFLQEKTPFGEAISVLRLDKSNGAVPRDPAWSKTEMEAAIKEYFFGDAKQTLSPMTLSVSYDELGIFRALDESESYDPEDSSQQVLEPAEISSELRYWTLAIIDASVNDPPETIRLAPVLGFIAIADVDEDRRRLKFLSPVMEQLGNRPLIWGKWPEPYLNLLG